MTEALVPAYLVHAVPGRIRLRIPDKRGDESYFSNLAQVLSKGREIAAVSVNAFTGSVVVRVAAGIKPADLASSARHLALFDVRESSRRAAPSALVTASAGLHGVDGLVARATGGYLDFKSGMFITLLILAGRQIYKGQFMVPGFTFLWYALTLMME